MSKQTLAVVVAAVVLFAAAVFGAMAFTGGDSTSDGNVHTMQDGSTMTEEMSGTDGMHTMEDGSTMDDMEMEP